MGFFLLTAFGHFSETKLKMHFAYFSAYLSTIILYYQCVNNSNTYKLLFDGKCSI